jgi:hypothetical protein
VLAAADAGDDESDMEEVPIPGQEAEVREMDVTATEEHEHPQQIEEDTATVMGQQTVSTLFFIEWKQYLIP